MGRRRWTTLAILVIMSVLMSGARAAQAHGITVAARNRAMLDFEIGLYQQIEPCLVQFATARYVFHQWTVNPNEPYAVSYAVGLAGQMCTAAYAAVADYNADPGAASPENGPERIRAYLPPELQSSVSVAHLAVWWFMTMADAVATTTLMSQAYENDNQAEAAQANDNVGVTCDDSRQALAWRSRILSAWHLLRSPALHRVEGQGYISICDPLS